jgi:uncharacterized membrane protein YhhN
MMNLKRFPYFTIFYMLIIAANILVLYQFTEYRSVAKPMIVTSLLGFYITNAQKQSNSFTMALIFALLGDIFLMIESESFFMLGLGSFLLMQILYIVEFLKDKTVFSTHTVLTYAGLDILGLLFLYILWPHLGGLQWPVAFYVLAICSMVATAISRQRNVRWYGAVIVGVFLFFISDAWIALTKFGVITDHISDIVIMTTYMAAQYLIVRGMVERDLVDIA